MHVAVHLAHPRAVLVAARPDHSREGFPRCECAAAVAAHVVRHLVTAHRRSPEGQPERHVADGVDRRVNGDGVAIPGSGRRRRRRDTKLEGNAYAMATGARERADDQGGRHNVPCRPFRRSSCLSGCGWAAERDHDRCRAALRKTRRAAARWYRRTSSAAPSRCSPSTCGCQRADP